MSKTMNTVKRVLITIGAVIVSFWYLVLWTIIFGVTGVLLMIDFIHKTWTERRIPWIKKVTDGWRDLFDRPFEKFCN